MAVLLVTEKADLAADLVVLALIRRGVDFFRLNADTIPFDGTASWSSVDGSGSVTDGEHSIALEDVEAVWFRRHPPRNENYAAREGSVFVEGVCRVLDDIYWMNEPDAVARAESKMWQLSVAARCGLKVPPTVVGNDHAAASIALVGPAAVAKTLGGARITDQGEEFHLFSQVLPWVDIDEESVRQAPLILQDPVKPGVDVRITFVGEDCFPVSIAVRGSNPPLDWRAASDDRLEYRSVNPPKHVLEGCREMNRRAGLEYAAYDFVEAADGTYWFLEVNPSGQWGWIEQALRLPISDRIAERLATGRCVVPHRNDAL